MVEKGLNKLFLGFIFIMLGFRIQGFDILPDIVGFLFFASGFSNLSPHSDYFIKAAKYNIPMVILSIFSLYQDLSHGEGLNLGLLGIPLSIISFVVCLLVVYYLFMGVKDMAIKKEQLDIALESNEKWNEYVILQIAVLLTFIMLFIPALAFIHIFLILIISIIFTIRITGFLKKCSQTLS